ncbi:MAG: copper amine oxidase N-terminal domain-containing protein [Thermoanaerobacter sp.]|nr:copper amine oxidase N-terminal domain-containing protein [Thermoanaerobacter sp.]
MKKCCEKIWQFISSPNKVFINKFLITILVLLLGVVSLIGGSVSFAEEKQQVDVYDQDKNLVKSVVFVLGFKEYFINNQTPGVKMDVAPYEESGRTFVPVRYLSNALGVTDKNIKWYEKQQLVRLSEPGFPVVELTVGKKQIKSNNEVKEIDVAPKVKYGRTFLPARWVAEALGYEVDFDQKLNLVVCWPKGEQKPDVKPIEEYIGKQKEDNNYVGKAGSIWLAKAEEFKGEPMNLNEFVWGDKYFTEVEDSKFTPEHKIMKIRPQDIPENGILMGKDRYYGRVILGVEFKKDGIYIKQADRDDKEHVGYGQIFLVEAGNKVRYGINMPQIKGYSTNPFVVEFPFSAALCEEYWLPDPKLEQVKGFLLQDTEKQVLYVLNPYFKGE